MSNIDFSQLITAEDKLSNLISSQRRQRDGLLAEFDKSLYRTALYWDSLTQAQRDERLAYRKALLDIPEQASFPYGIAWPDYPTL